MYANIFAQSKGSAIADESLLRHMIINSLRRIKEKFGMKYGRMVLCFDSGNTWRNDYFAYYKAERKAKRAEEPAADMKAMFDFIHEIQAELIEFGPYPCIKVPRAEADDIIAVLAKQSDESVLIASNDKDFVQLHSMCAVTYKTIDQYQSLKDKVVNCSKVSEDEPDNQLFELIARGDKSDGIPNVLSDDDTFVDPDKRQKPMRAGTLSDIINDICKASSIMETSGKVTKEIQRNWDRNERLIDLSCIPADIQDNILDEYNAIAEAKYQNKDRGIDFYKYMIARDMKIMADNTQSLMIGE